MRKMARISIVIVTISIFLVSCGKDSDKIPNKPETQSSTTTQDSTNSTQEQTESPTTAPEPAVADSSEASQSGSTKSGDTENKPATTPVEKTDAGSTAQPTTGNPAQESSSSPDSKDSNSNSELNGTQTEMLALAKKSGCLACHNVDKKVVGPAWRDVSKRYKGVAQAKTRLIEKISKGGRGNWTDVVGNAAMPPYFPRVSKENIEKLVDFVLSL